VHVGSRPQGKKNVLAREPNVKLEGGKSYTFVVAASPAKVDIIRIEEVVAKEVSSKSFPSYIPRSSTARAYLKETPMNLIERVKRILLSPRTEWAVIEAEPITPAELYTGYVMPLAAIGPVAQVIGYSVFGLIVPFLGTYRVPIGSAITTGIVTYVLTLIGTYLLGLIIDGLAPTFGAQRNPIQALKVAAYSQTAFWLAGVFALIPGLRLLQILGLYSLYLLYLGLPTLMKSPRDKTMGYTVVVILAAIVLFLLIGVIAGRFLAVPTAGLTMP
jgi:hypothetical protein